MVESRDCPSERGQLKIGKNLFRAIAIFSIVTIMIYLNIKEFTIFLGIIEIINVILAVSISVILLHTYGFSGHREFPLLGVAYLFISIFLLLHAVSISSQYQLTPISSVMLIIALYMESSTFFAKGMLLKKKNNIYLCVIIYSLISVLLLLEVFKWNFFFYNIISGAEIYYFKKGSMHIIGTIFLISAVVFYQRRKYIDKNIFQTIIAALLFKSLSAFILSFTLVDESNNLINLIGYFTVIISFYFLYMGIIIANLKKPYDQINMQNDTLKAILESTADGILVVDDIGKVLHYNKNFVRMWRIPSEIIAEGEDKELLSFVKNQLLYPDEFFNKVENLVENFSDDTSIIPFKDGRIYERFSKPLLINQEMCGRVWGFRDITEVMNMIEALKTKERIIETSLNAIACTDMEGKITYANQSFIDLHGYSRFEEIEDKKGVELSLNPSLDMKKIGEALLTTGKWSGEVTGKLKDKSSFDAECFAHMIYDKEEKPIHVVIFLNDISSRKEAEKKLAQREALYRKLIELLPDAVFVVKDEKIIITNNEGLKLSNYRSNEEIENRHHNEVINLHPDYAKVVKTRMNRLMEEETAVDFLEQKIVIKDGSIIDVEVAAASFKQEDEHYVVILARDISVRKKVEKLQQQTQLFSNIAHELKTPLNIILGSIQLLNSLHDRLVECPHYNKCSKYLAMMQQNCYRLLRLMNNLIDLTKADNGFLKLNVDNYNIVEVVENITQSVADYGKTKEISIIFDTDIEEKILGIDPDKIERILLNLLSNAIKFTEKGGSITVTVYENENTVGISVKDTGIGIPQNQLGEIFNRFKQVGSALHRKNEGSGIGLSLVKALVEAHDGKVSVTSSFGKGSEFIIELPNRLNHENPLEYAEAVALEREVNIEKICIEFSDVYSISA